MSFKLKAYLPSLQKDVQIKELTYRQYRELVKSLYSVDKEESINQYNSILLELCPEIENIDITFEDKLSLLFTVRNFCVSPDLKLKITTPNTNEFVYSVAVDNLIKNIKSINKSKSINLENIEVTFSSYKVRDEGDFIGNNKDTIKMLASYIDTIKIANEVTSFKGLKLLEREQIINNLPFTLYKSILKEIVEQQNNLEKLDLLTVIHPLTKDTVLKISQNITFETLQRLVGFCFTEELANVYRAFYNVVHYANFSPEYVDNITPIELQVYWMYFMEDAKRQSTDSKSSSKLQLPGSSGDKLGF